MLVFRFCAKPQEKKEECKSDRIVRALDIDGQDHILFLDLRNECRRMGNDSGCLPIALGEFEVLMASKVLELKIAQEGVGITIQSMFSFTGCWDRGRWDVILDALSLAPAILLVANRASICFQLIHRYILTTSRFSGNTWLVFGSSATWKDRSCDCSKQLPVMAGTG